MNQNNFYLKYLKYKNKYLQLKTQFDQVGGAKPLNNILKGINLFTDLDMEKYLNPIYGLIMAESGYIKNNFYLHQAGFANTPESIIINHVVREIPGTIQPTKDIVQKIKPETIGKYIGFLYITKSNWFKNLNEKSKALTKIITSQSATKEEKDSSIAQSKAINNLVKELNKFNKENIFGIKPGTGVIEHFHILLYCLWWISTDKSGIVKYYLGINDAFKLANVYEPESFSQIIIPENFVTEEFTKDEIDGDIIPIPSFELVIAKLTKKSFDIFNQEYAKSFCPEYPIYADCGETTVRNLLNLISFNHVSGFYDVNELKRFGAIEPVIEYYLIFKTPSIQASHKPQLIYGEELNARDAWSKLIILYGASNISWVRTCSTNNQGFELNSKMASDGTKSNILQIVQNLLPEIKSFSKINTKYITQVKDATTNGIGIITITHNIFGEIFIQCHSGHYFMEISKKLKKIKKLDALSDAQFEIYNIFSNIGMDANNYLWYNITGDYLPNLINGDLNETLKLNLVKLSLTTQYNPDVRKRIKIDVGKIPMEIFTKSKVADQYSYKSNNFNFISQIENFTRLDITLKNVNTITSVDLSPLYPIETIGDNFLTLGQNITNIDLTPLSNVKIIGDSFLARCKNLQTINLEKLTNITDIGYSFLVDCLKINFVDFSAFGQIKMLKKYFLSYCSNIKQVDLSPMKELINIDSDVLINMDKLEKVNLSGLSKLKKISHNFLSNCPELVEVNMQGLDSLEIVYGDFLSHCPKLKQINLTECPNLQYFIANGIGPDLKIICTEKQKPIITQMINKDYIANIIVV